MDYTIFKYFKKGYSIILAISPIAIIISVFYVFYCGVYVIVSDKWEIVSIIEKILSGTIRLSVLFMLYNQNIIFFPRIFKILFAFLTKYNNIAEMYVILFLMMVSFSIFYSRQAYDYIVEN